jgi:protein tyrosine/serine phosphatase
MAHGVRWLFGLALAAFVLGGPVVYYRYTYTTGKRLREVKPGVFYRSGQMTADGFADAVRRFGIRTIINAQDDYPDPDIQLSFLRRQTIKESELCRQLGVRYVHLSPDLVPKSQLEQRRPTAIDHFLHIMDDPANYPVLVHCRAGLHRTGVLTAVYRMEYHGWTVDQALREVKANGFGEFACTPSNDYIDQYILRYCPGIRCRDNDDERRRINVE